MHVRNYVNGFNLSHQSINAWPVFTLFLTHGPVRLRHAESNHVDFSFENSGAAGVCDGGVYKGYDS